METRQDEIRKIRAEMREKIEQSWPKLPPIPTEPLERLSFWHWVGVMAETEVVNAMDDSKAIGATWMDVGTAFERSAEGARQFRMYRESRS